MAAKKPATTGKVTQAAKPKSRKPAPKKATAKAQPVPEPTPIVEFSPEDQLLAIMDPRHVMFVEQYLVDLNATKAYLAAFEPTMRDNVARACSSRLLTTANVQKLLSVRVKAMFDRSEGLQDRMLAQQFALAFADPNELVEHRRDACRFCYGDNHLYQFKPSEFEDRRVEWEKRVTQAVQDGEEPPEWDPRGGVGYDPRREPIDSCPECYGEGEPRIVMKDTRNLSPGARALYANAKFGKDGLEIVTHSQEKARDVLLKYLKIYDDKVDVVLGVVPQEKLDAIYDLAMENAKRGREATQGRQRKVDTSGEGA